MERRICLFASEGGRVCHPSYVVLSKWVKAFLSPVRNHPRSIFSSYCCHQKGAQSVTITLGINQQNPQGLLSSTSWGTEQKHRQWRSWKHHRQSAWRPELTTRQKVLVWFCSSLDNSSCPVSISLEPYGSTWWPSLKAGEGLLMEDFSASSTSPAFASMWKNSACPTLWWSSVFSLGQGPPNAVAQQINQCRFQEGLTVRSIVECLLQGQDLSY